MKHKCEESEGALFTIEDRGEGWYLYYKDSKGDNPINFCPCCGKKVEDFGVEEREEKHHQSAFGLLKTKWKY